MNKRGSVLDILFLLIIMFVLALTMVIGYKMFYSITNDLADMYPDNEIATKTATNLPQMFLNYDKLFMILFVFGLLSSVILAAFIETHPVFTIINLILLIIFTFISAHFSNLYEAFETSSTISAEAAQFSITSYFWLHAPMFCLIAMALVIIITYAKGRAPQPI